ncbi:polymorphic toxin-type HINT domain-containing protein [Streptomyces cinnamoneus]
MADGTSKAIEDVRVGDKVLATDPQTGETAPKTVTATIITPDDKEFTDLTLSDDANPRGPPATLTSTAHHPHWNETRRQWLDAGEFTPTPEFDASVSAGGRYIWSVDVAGTLRMAPARPGIKHPILTEGSPVVGAGEAQINARGIVEYINNHTGHYTPCQACSGEFLMNGVRAFEAAGVPVLRRGITNLGGR